MNNYASKNSKGCVFEVGLEYPKELQEFHNEYLLASNKIEIHREMLFEYQVKISDLHNISNFSDKEKYVLHYENLQRYLRLGLKLRKNTLCIRI